MFILEVLAITSILIYCFLVYVEFSRVKKLNSKQLIKWNDLQNHYGILKTVISANNDLIAPLSLRPCCWYSITYESFTVGYYYSRWTPQTMRRTDKILKIQDKNGVALLATHGSITNSNTVWQILNSEPDLEFPQEFPSLIKQSNKNIILHLFNKWGRKTIKNTPYNLDKSPELSIWDALRGYSLTYHRLRESVLFDGQEIYILGVTEPVKQVLNSDSKGKIFLLIEDLKDYAKTHDLQSEKIDTVVNSNHLLDGSFIISDSIDNIANVNYGLLYRYTMILIVTLGIFAVLSNVLKLYIIR